LAICSANVRLNAIDDKELAADLQKKSNNLRRWRMRADELIVTHCAT
jgi:hypothetical protein